MTDKVQKIKEWISKTQDGLMDANGNFEYLEHEGAYHILCSLDAYIDSMQGEPKFKTGNKVIYLNEEYEIADITDHYILHRVRTAIDGRISVLHLNFDKEELMELVEEPVSEDLGEYIDELSKQFPEVSFAKLSRIAVRVAKWQKEQFEKNRLKHCNSITNEQAELEQGFIDQHLDEHQRMPTFLDAIEYGMKKMKEQMMANAVDGDITFDYYGDNDKTYGCIAHDSFCLEDFGLKDREKVKMILIKED